MKILLAAILVVFYVGLPDVTNGQLPGLPLDCPVGWKKNYRTNMCYWFNNNDFVPQYKAGQKCGNRGGHLVMIDDEDENNFITDNYKINPNDTVQSEYAWTGLYEQWEGKWVWEHYRADLGSYSVWAAGQPDDVKNEDYMAIRAVTGEWYDMRSNFDYGYICEKEIPPKTDPPPTNPPAPTPAP